MYGSVRGRRFPGYGGIRERTEWLETFLELPHGIPDSDTFRWVFERINPEALSECLYDWLGCHRKEGSVITIDGKTIRGSKRGSRKAYHVVGAFAAENQLVLGEIVTDEKPNEITAVPELMGALNIEWDGLQAVGMVTAAISKNDETTRGSPHRDTK